MVPGRLWLRHNCAFLRRVFAGNHPVESSIVVSWLFGRMSDLAWALGALPLISAACPGVGGVLRRSPEDFVVEEIPAYLPEGAGEFLYLWIEKRGLAAEQLTSLLARLFKIGHSDVGMAGLKDRHAVTRQWVSVPKKCETMLCAVDHPQITILETNRHKNKLRPGHLRGNRFRITVHDVGEDSLERSRLIADVLKVRGMANYYGEQRFGYENETLLLGLDLLGGRKTPKDIPRARRKFLLRLALSAVQSALFNRFVADRLATDKLHAVEKGDVMQVVASGGPFVVEDPEREQPRFDAREIVLAGPMFGPKMKQAMLDSLTREDELLTRAGLNRDDFGRYPDLTSGTRRPCIVWPGDLEVTAPATGGIEFSFSLPSGSYATVLMREVMKESAPETPQADPVDEESSESDTTSSE